LDWVHELQVFLLSLFYAALGIVLLFIGYKVFDLLTPTDMDKAIFVEKNTAVGMVAGFFVLGLAVVIAAAIAG